MDRPRRLNLLCTVAGRALATALLASTVGCGADGQLDLWLEDDWEDDHDPCCVVVPPPVSVHVQIEGRDSLDGFVDPDGFVAVRSGLRVEDGGAVSFVSFSLDSIPWDAWLVSAELVLVDTEYVSFGGPIELDVSGLDYGDVLDSLDPAIPGDATVAVRLGYGAAGAAVVIDVVDLLDRQLARTDALFQVRLDAYGGDLTFEDGGGNLGTGGVPILSVVFED